MSQQLELLPMPSVDCVDPSVWANAIMSAWRAGVAGIFGAGDRLAAAKKALPHGDFLDMVEEQLPFGKRKAQMLMAIAADKRLREAQNFALLPPSIPALYDISRLDDEPLEEALSDGTISPAMERGAISTRGKQNKREQIERSLGARQCALPDGKFGVILADPEWKFEVWSEKGKDRSADNHYPTSALDEIFKRDVRSIAANDCVLFLWATVPMLPQALAVLAEWGFTYKSHFVWVKDKAGTGYWNRNKHELLLIGTKGEIPAPAPGTQFISAIAADVGEHSAKPEIFLQLIEKYFPTLPKIELNRRGPARLGWAAWGNEAEKETAA